MRGVLCSLVPRPHPRLGTGDETRCLAERTARASQHNPKAAKVAGTCSEARDV